MFFRIITRKYKIMACNAEVVLGVQVFRECHTTLHVSRVRKEKNNIILSSCMHISLNTYNQPHNHYLVTILTLFSYSSDAQHGNNASLLVGRNDTEQTLFLQCFFLPYHAATRQ